MGGGSGVSFKSESADRISISVELNRDGTIKDIIVDLFNNISEIILEGYDDGGTMSVDNDRLVIFDKKEEDIKNIVLEHINKQDNISLFKSIIDKSVSSDNIEYIKIYIEYEYELNQMYWAGYIRGNIEHINEFDVDLVEQTDPELEIRYTDNTRDTYVNDDDDLYKIFENLNLYVCFIKKDDKYFNELYNYVMDFQE